MKSSAALRVLAGIAESQWGMVTSAQARSAGVPAMTLTRLAGGEHLVRVAHGVYRDSGAPSPEHEDLRAAWLVAEAETPAWKRLQSRPWHPVVSGLSAAAVHGIGDLRPLVMEFTTAQRRQTQRDDLRYRRRELPDADVTLRGGLPVTTPERTIADLVEDRQDLSTVADALRDASRQSVLDVERLARLLAPLASRNGYPGDDGQALLDDLMRLAGLDLETVASQVAAVPGLRDRVIAQQDGAHSTAGESSAAAGRGLTPMLMQVQVQMQAALRPGDVMRSRSRSREEGAGHED